MITKSGDLPNYAVLLLQRCGRLDDQIALLKHKLYLIQQGLAFNGKRTKTARSQGKKFQVSVEQEATRLLVLNLIQMLFSCCIGNISIAQIMTRVFDKKYFRVI